MKLANIGKKSFNIIFRTVIFANMATVQMINIILCSDIYQYYFAHRMI